MTSKHLSSLLGAAAAAFLLACSAAHAAEREIPPAFGPYIKLAEADFAGSRSFSAKDKIVATYYFYWYDILTKSHIINHDGTDALTTHPPTLVDFSYKSVAWHKRQFSDMMEAGIDVALPVFWGAPSEQHPKAGLHWSYEGLKVMVQAREEMLKAGRKPPLLGLFYDTSTLQFNQWGVHVDLTTDYGRRWFYATIRDFFSMVPPRHWAMIEGRPLVLLYAAAFAKNHDQSCVDYLMEQFPKDFGGRRPYFVRQNSWNVKADNTVAWGGALGLVNPGVASLGPGYDHSAVPGRDPLVVDRRGGKFYEEQWLKFLRRPSNLVTIETWNEFHEGTDICESKEYGRQYIALTRKYVRLFKQGYVPPWPKGAYHKAAAVSILMAEKNTERGLQWIENEDGKTTPATAGGQPCRAAQITPQGGTYMYFAVDDSFKLPGTMNGMVFVEYFDAAPGVLGLEYDGSDPAAPFGGAYTRAKEAVKLTGSQTWQTAQFQLPGARFVKSQNRGADFRLVVQSPALMVKRVELRKR